MKRAVAILLSLVMIWVQGLASAQTLPTETAASQCGCCYAKKSCGCVAESASTTAPIPATPPSNVSVGDHPAVLASFISWQLPPTTPELLLDSAGASLGAQSTPLFTQHCALLI